MDYFYLVPVFIGCVILLYCMYRYHQTIGFMKQQIYEGVVFNSKIYTISFYIIGFFFVGYLAIGFFMAFYEYRFSYIVIAAVLFMGAMFVWCMVQVIRTMAKTITLKTVEIIQSMIDVMEAKDLYTKGHSVHVKELAALIYKELPGDMKVRVNLRMLEDAALLHDIGKIGVPDDILNKPGHLTEEEMNVVRQHPRLGSDILGKTSYHSIARWVLYHHERMDGNGYYGLPGEEIPLEARILAVADTFSALYTDRVYRKRFDYATAENILKESAGTQLDPFLVDLFCAIGKEKIDRCSNPSNDLVESEDLKLHKIS